MRPAGCLCRCLVLVCLGPALVAGEAQEDPGPDALAVQMLQLINRYRADPAGDVRRMLQVDPLLIPGLGHAIDVALLLREIDEVPTTHPLLYDPQLTTSARAHAGYLQIHAVVQHHEDPTAAGFTGLRPPQRAVAAGWTSPVVGENCAGPAIDAWSAHLSFVIDWTAADDTGDGGMQPGRGHRVSLGSPRFTRVGLGLVADPQKRGRLWVVQNFGLPVHEQRRAGGVVFIDANRDGLCDPGEGVAGVTVQVLDTEGVEQAVAVTQPTGHWLVTVPGRAVLSLRFCQRRAGGEPKVVDTRELPVVVTHWTETRLPEAQQFIDYLLAVNALPATGHSRRRAALASLLQLADGLPLADEYLVPVATARAELAAADALLLPLLNGFERRYRTEDHAALRREVADLGRRYRATALGTWATDAELLLDAYQGAWESHQIAHAGKAVPLATLQQYERASQVGRRITWPSLKNLYRDVERAMATLGRKS